MAAPGIRQMKVHAFRLKPGQDLRAEIEAFAKANKIAAGAVVTCVGGLSKAVLRMPGATPGKQTTKTYNEKTEIVSLVGTLAENGSHLHISLSRKDGSVIGGHLKMGSLVVFTAEVVIMEFTGMTFVRELDRRTGFEELSVKQ
jgi:uncharacterized protein